MWAAGDVQVDRLLDCEASIEQICERDCMRFCVRRSKTAALVAGACDCSTEHTACGEVESGGEYGLFRGFKVVFRDVRYHEILPHGQPNLTAAETVRNIRHG